MNKRDEEKQALFSCPSLNQTNSRVLKGFQMKSRQKLIHTHLKPGKLLYFNSEQEAVPVVS
jgi:hypothetical protein